MTWPTEIQIIDTEIPGIRGFLSYQLSNPLTNSSTGAVYPNEIQQVRYNSSGVASTSLPVVDDAATTPTGSYYTVTKVIQGAPSLTWEIQPTLIMGASVSLGSITPITPVPPVAPYAIQAEIGTTLGFTSLVDGDISLDFATNWGIDGEGNPFYDAGGVTGSEAAILLPGTLTVVKPGTYVPPSGGGSSLTVDTVVTGATANISAGHYTPVDTTAQSCVLTLPNAPADQTQCGAKMVIQGSTNTVQLHTSGSDVINKSGGATTYNLTLANQGVLLQYTAATGIWTALADDLALSQLDLRYLSLAGGTVTGPVAMGANKITGLANGSNPQDAAAFGQIPTLPGQVGAVPSIRPAAWTSESLPRWAISSNVAPVLASGTLHLTAVFLPSGTVVNNLNFMTGTTPASGTISHWWMGLYDNNLNQLATTADQGSGAIGAGLRFIEAIAAVASGAASSFTTTYSGLHYVGLMVAAGTVPTLLGVQATYSIANALAPIPSGNSSIGQTTPPAFPFTAGALSAASTTPYVGTS